MFWLFRLGEIRASLAAPMPSNFGAGWDEDERKRGIIYVLGGLRRDFDGDHDGVLPADTPITGVRKA